MLEIRRFAPGAITIMGFSPMQGGVGRLVTVTGAGFNPDPSQNTVQLNGTAAPALSATSAQLTFAVPSGATTGRITVTNGGNTATSADDFTVATDATVTIVDFTPKLGRAGTPVTISGTGFDPDPINDRVLIGALGVPIGTASATSLSVTARNSSGKVRVYSLLGNATSSDDFFILPGSYSASDVDFTARLLPDGPSQNARVNASGHIALLLFDGTAGQGVTLRATTAASFPSGVQVNAYAPDGRLVGGGTLYSNNDVKWALGTGYLQLLPVTGPYMVVVTPGASDTGTVSLALIREQTGTLGFTDPAQQVTLSSAQNGRYTFRGNQGDLLSLAVPSFQNNPPGGNMAVLVLRANGDWFWLDYVGGPWSFQLPQLPASENYTMRFMPSGTRASTFTVLMSSPLTGALTVDGAATQYQTTRPGQTGRYTFAGTVGQGLTLRVTVGATFPSGVQVYAYKPDGTQVGGATLYNNSDVKLSLGTGAGLLPASGTYAVVVTPGATDTGTVSLTLLSEATGTLVVGATPQQIQLSTAQNGRFAFSGNQGDLLSIGVPSFQNSPPGGDMAVQVLRANGDWFWLDYLGGPWSFQLPQLPASENYTMRFMPSGTHGSTFTVLLSSPLTGTLTVDGAPTQYQTARPGQSGRYSFAGTAGQGLTLRATAGATFPIGVQVYAYAPDGTQVGGGSLLSNSDLKWGLGSGSLQLLPATGTYTVVVTPGATDTGTVSLTLLSEATGTLVVGAAPQQIQLSTGQNGRYTFSGNQGDLLSIGVPSFQNNPPGGDMWMQVLRPTGDGVWWDRVAGPWSFQLPPLPASETYTLRLVPGGTRGSTLTLQLSRP
jgi:hypothetical protein